MRQQRNRVSRGATIGVDRAWPWRGVVGIVGVMCALSLCVGAVCIKAAGFALGLVSLPEPPVASEFFDTWCSSRGDRLTLADGSFTIDRMSPALAGQIVYSVPTPDPGRSHRDDPPATSAAGSWDIDVQGADAMADNVVSIQISVERLDGQAVASEVLELDTDEQDAGWSFYLRPRLAGSGEMTFSRCPNA